ncbi:hypothetical protein D3C78_1819480 [compost metagenome]
MNSQTGTRSQGLLDARSKDSGIASARPKVSAMKNSCTVSSRPVVRVPSLNRKSCRLSSTSCQFTG